MQHREFQVIYDHITQLMTQSNQFVTEIWERGDWDDLDSDSEEPSWIDGDISVQLQQDISVEKQRMEKLEKQ